MRVTGNKIKDATFIARNVDLNYEQTEIFPVPAAAAAMAVRQLSREVCRKTTVHFERRALFPMVLISCFAIVFLNETVLFQLHNTVTMLNASTSDLPRVKHVMSFNRVCNDFSRYCSARYIAIAREQFIN